MDYNRETVVSFVVVNRNTAALLIRCLNHIFQSRLPQIPQVIVVDNGSTDDSVAQVRNAYPDVEIIEAGRNLGFAAANNRAFRISRGQFLMLVNTDAMLEPECAGRLLDLMKADPQIGMAGPQLLNNDGTPQTSFEAVPTLATETLNRSLLKRLFPGRFPGKRVRLECSTQVEALIGAVMMIRRKAIEEIGEFDENYFFFLEETDLAVRMRKAGWKVVHDPSSKAVHLQGATAKTYRADARIEFYRSRYLFFRKHYGLVAESILRAVIAVNLSLNVIGLGLATAVTFGKSRSVAGNFHVRNELWKWHLHGCPDGKGLPRT
ncbi:glycosyltransferase family 2 protein [Desulfomonile tiedjei]|uniref:Putative glycosyltransferase n=1 Tax=Desulfomonile tiedjei (strain ATCC 49306 / DSM 6799 / DCB-1) TaxID=706587 RepID=I4C3W2_DESTA|nr:glycosyltransferase family 2 protein [Desulfomonile tiedjei]AFM24253.1 putative glycosyltransferase [Desulfomonile tiedjei DSM 6799]